MVVSLQDPTLAHGPADNTGTNYVNDSFADAIAKALTFRGGSTNGWGVVISGAPGTYKWDMSRGGLGVPGGVYFTFGDGALDAAIIEFTETGYPTAIGATPTSGSNSIAGQTTQQVNFVKNTFPPASPGNPQPVCFDGQIVCIYTGITSNGTVSGFPSVILTGISPAFGAPNGPTPGPAFQVPVIAGCAVYLCSGGGRGRAMLDKSVTLYGPGTGNFSTWGTATPPANGMDGVFVGQQAGEDCSVIGFRQGVLYCGDYETFGGSGKKYNNWCNYALESVPGIRWAQNITSGNQLFEAGAASSVVMPTVYWCHHFITANNHLVSADFMQQRHEGYAPWWMWKDSITGVTQGDSGIAVETVLHQPIFESLGLGIIGCADGQSEADVTIEDGGVTWNASARPSGFSAPVASFACNGNGLVVDGLAGLNGSGSPPLWKADQMIGKFHNLAISIAASNQPISYSGSSVICDVKFDDGVVSQTDGSGIQAGDLFIDPVCQLSDCFQSWPVRGIRGHFTAADGDRPGE